MNDALARQASRSSRAAFLCVNSIRCALPEAIDETFTPPGYDGRPSTAANMSEWRAAINRKALARLTKALPAIFPTPVLTHALQRAFTPPMPRLAIDSYWRTHPVRADRLARALAAKSGTPAGWTWRLADERPARVKRRGRKPDELEPDWLAASFRMPPAPYRERRHARGPGFCRICGQKVYRFGWHVDLWDRGANMNATWHAACVVAWDLWTAPSDMPACSSGCSEDAAPRPARGYGGPPRSIIAFRCSGCGASIATRPGRCSSVSGACRTCRSSIATFTRASARPKHGRAES
jgi:hypothetical protein